MRAQLIHVQAHAVRVPDSAFVGLAKVMRDEGVMQDSASSADHIRAWLSAHRGHEA